MARAPRELIDPQVWPEFQELEKTLRSYLSEVTKRIIATAIHEDVSEPEVRTRPKGLARGSSIDLQ